MYHSPLLSQNQLQHWTVVKEANMHTVRWKSSTWPSGNLDGSILTV